MMSRFIDGPPSGLRFLVRSGRPMSLTDAMQSARIGDAYGYRKEVDPVSIPGNDTSHTVCAAEKQPRDDERLPEIEQQLQTVMNSLSKLPLNGPEVQSPKSRDSRHECHKCGGRDHFKKVTMTHHIFRTFQHMMTL